MLVLVSYDVSTKTPAGKKRLRRVAEACEDFGQRVQNSVFECQLDPEHWARLRARLLRLYHPEEDSPRFYFLGKRWSKRIEHHGINPSIDFRGPLLA